MFIDSHCHLDFEAFDGQRDALMLRCLALDVMGFLVPATTYEAWSTLAVLAQQYPSWRVAYGLHPYFLKEALYRQVERLGEQCEREQVVAVGEIGLDNWPGAVDMAVQMAFFSRQLKVASALKLPVILHARKSYDLVFKCLREADFKEGGVVHAFNGSLEQAKRFRGLGFVMGIGGTITYPRAQKAQRVLASLDTNAFILETDSPDMPLHGFQGKHNTPLSIPSIAHHVARIKGMTVEQVAAQTYDNLLSTFPKWHEGLL
ncbi:TatD family hydrolase [Marinomonas sp. M1K-6]|uniref:TatD family hydrolase n=1 Tax=Marinomonas profundi TaxID=2726122 RepID=A0A847QWI4_9GAMM|nr:TatD family hydrolase [Marinomonas profundi]NLQ16479.1 TatD family hydrolase [Marinomonas profundi]UDV03931.1 TatD family hydrolase [Marinomonas profundi]